MDKLLAKGNAIENEDIDENVKAKFFVRLVREFRK